MKYMGSKSRIAKHIVPILCDHRTLGQTYVEPFVGGFNMLEHLTNPRIAGDVNKYLIALFQAIQSGWKPPEYVPEELYYQIKWSPNRYPPELVGFVGFGCSYAGRWWEGYARDTKKLRNYARETCNNLLRQATKLTGVKIVCSDFRWLTIPSKSLIYCDPPYQGVKCYGRQCFPHDEFWQWARQMSQDGHKIFISEYSAPPDFRCIWEAPTALCSSLTKNTGDMLATERLFVPP